MNDCITTRYLLYINVCNDLTNMFTTLSSKICFKLCRCKI